MSASAQFKMVLDGSNPMGVGKILDGKNLVSRAKMLGFLEGGGREQYLAGFDRVFPNQATMAEFLDTDNEARRRVLQMLTVHLRKTNGVAPVPHDGWLDGPVPPDVIALATTEPGDVTEPDDVTAEPET